MSFLKCVLTRGLVTISMPRSKKQAVIYKINLSKPSSLPTERYSDFLKRFIRLRSPTAKEK